MSRDSPNPPLPPGTTVKYGSRRAVVGSVMNGASFGERTYLLNLSDGTVAHVPWFMVETPSEVKT